MRLFKPPLFALVRSRSSSFYHSARPWLHERLTVRAHATRRGICVHGIGPAICKGMFGFLFCAPVLNTLAMLGSCYAVFRQIQCCECLAVLNISSTHRPPPFCSSTQVMDLPETSTVFSSNHVNPHKIRYLPRHATGKCAACSYISWSLIWIAHSNLAAYNLRQAAQYCNGESPRSWQQWASTYNCSNTSSPPAQPTADFGVSLPNWATQALSAGGTFDIEAALHSECPVLRNLIAYQPKPTRNSKRPREVRNGPPYRSSFPLS